MLACSTSKFRLHISSLQRKTVMTDCVGIYVCNIAAAGDSEGVL